jgi:hypothetical protein
MSRCVIAIETFGKTLLQSSFRQTTATMPPVMPPPVDRSGEP